MPGNIHGLFVLGFDEDDWPSVKLNPNPGARISVDYREEVSLEL